MESALVSARVPRAKKEAASSLLESLGSTTSELINSAFEYLIENKSLPTSEASISRNEQTYIAFVSEATLSIDWGPEAEFLDYKAIIREGKRAEYESLA